MPELPFPDLATPAAQETVPPLFEEIVGRARRRRRNKTLAVAAGTLAALVVVTSGAIATLGHDQASPGPVGPSPTVPAPSATSTPSTKPADATEVTRDGVLISYAASGQSLMTVWELCGTGEEEGTCHYAWQLQSGSGIHRGLVRGSRSPYAAGGSFVLPSWTGPGLLVEPDGTVRTLRRTTPRAVTSTDVLVRLDKGLGAVDPTTGEVWSLPGAADVEGWGDGAMAADGTVWATTSPPSPTTIVDVSWLAPGTTSWQHHTVSTSFADGPATGPVAVSGDHVATFSMHDGVDVATFGRMAVTTDGGASWSDLRPGDLPFDNVDAVAATSGGTLYVASMDSSGHHRLFRSTGSSWTTFSEVRDAPEVSQLVPAGDRVIARGGTLHRAEIYRLDDAGHVTQWASLR